MGLCLVVVFFTLVKNYLYNQKDAISILNYSADGFLTGLSAVVGIYSVSIICVPQLYYICYISRGLI